MLRIPFDGPNLEGKRALVHTHSGMLRGIVIALAPEGLDLAVDGMVRHFERDQIRAIAPV